MQAMEDARFQLAGLIDRVQSVPGAEVKMVGANDLKQIGLVLDTFVQSFDGSAGRIWRQAMLIDASPEKLASLNDRVHAIVHVERTSWARMIASALGVFAVIVVTYLFLNMATKGYYDWSLRIVGLILAIVGVIFIFLLS
jgi:hypothetical protein